MLFLGLEFLQSAAGVTCIGIEFECLFVVADGGFGHVFVFTFAAKDGVFGCQALQKFIFLFDFLFKFCDLGFLTVDDFQFPADETADMWLLDVVA